MTTMLIEIFLATSILVFGIVVAKVTEAKFARIASRSVRGK